MGVAAQFEVLLVEDDAGDVALTQAAIRQWNEAHQGEIAVNLRVAGDGVEALKRLRREGAHAEVPRPDLVLLDLNLPVKDGRELLRDMKADPALKSIPVVVVSTSEDAFDVKQSYTAGANCYVTKPVGFQQYRRIVEAVGSFWLSVARLPSR